MHWADRIGRHLKLRDLHILLAVVEWGSMSKAAKRLAISPPVVSKAIADLERTLGVPLLDRNPQGVEPTMYGRALLNGGVAVFDELRQRVKEIEFLANPTVGELRIGCHEWIAAGLLPVIIDRLSRQHPRIVIDVDNAIARTLEFRELRERTIDLVLARIPIGFAEENLEVEIFYQEQIHVVVGAQSPWGRRRKIDLAELVDEPWILMPPSSLGTSLVTEAFEVSGLKVPRASVVSFSIQLRNHLLATGRYLSILPGSVLRFSATLPPLKVLPIDLLIAPRPVAIISLRNRTLSPAVEIFKKFTRTLTQ